MPAPHVLERLQSYIAGQHVVSLATLSVSGPWAASCYYAFDAEAMALVIKSSLNTVHAAAMIAQPRIAGTIAGQPASITEICGIQFTAVAELLAEDDEVAAHRQYCRRHVAGRVLPGRYWRLVLGSVKYTDNLRFLGQKILWDRQRGVTMRPRGTPEATAA